MPNHVPHRASRVSERFFLAALVSLLAALPGCITETSRPKPGLTRSSEVLAHPDSKSAAADAPRPTTATTPIARPAGSARTRDTRVRVSVRPVGRIPYDGLTLPLVSPDGRFLAAQVGQAPAWDALLSQPGAFVPSAARLAVWHLGDASQPGQPPVQPLQPVAGPEALPAGLLLGRSCSDEGYLVEAPRPDGSRRIGQVSWVGGKLSWLVDDAAVNAFATLGPAGQLVFCRLDPSTGRWMLVVRPRAESAADEYVVESRGDESLVFPLAGIDRAHVYALAFDLRAAGSLSIVAVSLGGPGAKAPAGQIVARERLGVEPTIAAAFQAVAPMQTPWPGDPRSAGLLGEGVAVVSARAKAAMWFSPTTGLVPLTKESVSAVPMLGPTAAGLLCATGRELVLQTERVRATASPELGRGWEAGASVISSAAIPRATASMVTPIVLLNPDSDSTPPALGILLLSPEARNDQ